MKHSWKKTSLGELQKQGLADVQTGPFGTVLKASEYSEEGVPVISVGEIREGFLQVTERTPVVSGSTTKRLPKFLLAEGDIVFGRKGAIDRNSIINEKQAGWFLGSDAIRLRLSKKINSIFISYQLRSKGIGKWLLQNSSGSIMASLNQKVLDRLPLMIPEKPIQDKIASTLSSIDSKIDLNNRINAELEALAKTIYDYWFVQFEFPSEALAKDGVPRPYKSSGGEMVWNEKLRREVPKGWTAGELKDIANITMGQSPPGDSYNEDGVGTVFYQGCTDFGPRFPTVRKYTTKPSRFAQAGDILLSVRAPVGTMNIANEDCCIGRGLAALKSKNGSDSYLYEVLKYFKQIFDRRNTDGTTFGAITKNDLFSLPVVIPPSEIIDSFEAAVGAAFKKLNVIEAESRELASLRDWLLPMLMNGQVKVGEKTPTFSKVQNFGKVEGPASTAVIDLEGLDRDAAAKVIELPPTQEKEEKHFVKRKMLAAYIINQSLNDPHFGNTKFEKLLHLADYHVLKRNLGQKYFKKPAGPYDNAFTYAFFAQVEKAKWFRREGRGPLHRILGGENQAKSTNTYDYFSEEELAGVDEIIGYFKSTNYEKPEIISTLYAVWNNRLRNKELITDPLLKKDFLEWDDKKKRYEHRLDAALQWMRENGVVPDGWGDVIERKEN